MNYKQDLSKMIVEVLDGQVDQPKVLNMIEKPKFSHMGDFAFPCFELAKMYRKSPQIIAQEIAVKIESPLISKIEVMSGYLNIFLNKRMVAMNVINEIISKQHHYGGHQIGNGEVVTIDFSSPNIAKPFSMGHLRSTVIGNALALISEKCGYRPFRINHLGDFGTQFGKLIVAYKLWGDEQKVKENPIKELLALYVKFHDEAEKNLQLDDQAREWFKRLEEGDGEALRLWNWFKEESLKEFSKIYDLLGIKFDSYHGEAFYNDKMENIVQTLKDMNLLEESEGAQVVSLQQYDLPPCLIKKRDGTSLYATRDLAAATYRHDTYHFAKSIYVVGNEQTLHFKQVFSVVEKMGYQWHDGLIHIPFGMILKDGKKMSTRKGKVVLLEEVLYEAIELAKKNISTKNPELFHKEKVAREVGVGAVIFHDLKHYRMNDIEFSLHDMLKFEGETGPYVQYTHARASSLLRKGKYSAGNTEIMLEEDEAWKIITNLMDFPEIVERAMKEYDPSLLAKYVLDLSKEFNKYYGAVRILEDTPGKESRLSLVYTVTVVLKEGLRLLGLQAPEEM
ncbi:arginine--tRNA ligase [Bacillus salitolerans]|uniref:Arginine--tRNA ligase n=1 Tax=Bacillus salitolerans TaxID=1437434 RepID=A0ABW4LML7_9BACI